jgi:hypothetical protein
LENVINVVIAEYPAANIEDGRPVPADQHCESGLVPGRDVPSHQLGIGKVLDFLHLELAEDAANRRGQAPISHFRLGVRANDRTANCGDAGENGL